MSDAVGEVEGESDRPPPARLIPLGNDHYRVEGMPEDFTATFSEKDGGIVLIGELGSWPPVVAEKRVAELRPYRRAARARRSRRRQMPGLSQSRFPAASSV